MISGGRTKVFHGLLVVAVFASLRSSPVHAEESNQRAPAFLHFQKAAALVRERRFASAAEELEGAPVLSALATLSRFR